MGRKSPFVCPHKYHNHDRIKQSILLETVHRYIVSKYTMYIRGVVGLLVFIEETTKYPVFWSEYPRIFRVFGLFPVDMTRPTVHVITKKYYLGPSASQTQILRSPCNTFSRHNSSRITYILNSIPYRDAPKRTPARAMPGKRSRAQPPLLYLGERLSRRDALS